MSAEFNFFNDFVEEKLLHLHTNYLGKVIRVNENEYTCDIQPLTLTKSVGGKEKEQAVISKVPCLAHAWKYVSSGVTVLCCVCERDISVAKNGASALPSSGRHSMRDSIVLGVLSSGDFSPIGSNSQNSTNVVMTLSEMPTVNDLFVVAEKYIGTPYTFGGTPPKSFDCSGFVCWCYTQSGLCDLPKTTAQNIYNKCTKISKKQAAKGDLIFFTNTNTANRDVTHVGIYDGDDKMIHCGSSGVEYTLITDDYWQNHLYGFGKLI